MNPPVNQNRPPTRRLAAIAVTAAALAAFAAPAVASAATDRWVDADTGSNAGGNDCTVQATPCKTIMQASDSSQLSGTAGTIHVDQGSYGENVNIAQSNHLLADDFVPGDGGDETTIAGNGTGSTLFVQATASASGFTLTSATAGSVVLLADGASLEDNTIVAEADNSTGVEVFASTGSPKVTGNTILAGDGNEGRGVQVDQNVASATIADNQIGSTSQGFDTGIEVRANSSAQVTGNVIQGLNQRFGTDARGVLINGADDATLSGNEINSPLTPAGEHATGIYVTNVDADGTVALDHNQIIGLSGMGVVFADVAGTATMENDVIARTGDYGFYAGNVADLSIENETVYDTGSLVAGNAQLTIDSSIVDEPILSSGGSTCQITYSRGPAIVQGGDGCGDFQSTLDPKFVDRFGATPDLHLAADSPMIDAGNPAAPAAGATDIDGDARALEGDGACPIDAERDIGADEAVKAVPSCPVDPDPDPDTDDRKPPQTSIAGTRRQRGHHARFILRSSEKGSTFECRVDKGRFAACPPAFRSERLSLGKHRLIVRAIDAAGNVDASPAVKRFKLKPRHR